MVSAGLDTVPGNLIMGIAYLSSAHGQEIQRRAYDEILKIYPDGDAWERCLLEEKVPYVTALVKEILRFWTVIPICLPRKSIKDIRWQQATIPAGTTFYMVDISHLINRSKTNSADVPLFRMRGQLTTTQPTSRIQIPSNPNDTLTAQPRVPVLHITVMVLGRECAWAPISPTASCTQHSFDWFQLSK